jgi:hypothetical protein
MLCYLELQAFDFALQVLLTRASQMAGGPFKQIRRESVARHGAPQASRYGEAGVLRGSLWANTTGYSGYTLGSKKLGYRRILSVLCGFYSSMVLGVLYGLCCHRLRHLPVDKPLPRFVDATRPRLLFAQLPCASGPTPSASHRPTQSTPSALTPRAPATASPPRVRSRRGVRSPSRPKATARHQKKTNAHPRAQYAHEPHVRVRALGVLCAFAGLRGRARERIGRARHALCGRNCACARA